MTLFYLLVKGCEAIASWYEHMRLSYLLAKAYKDILSMTRHPKEGMQSKLYGRSRVKLRGKSESDIKANACGTDAQTMEE